MKKIKRIIAFVMTAGLLLTSFAGCGEQNEREEEKINQEKPVVTEEPAATEEPTVPTEDFSFDAERKEFEVERNFLEYTLSEEDIATFEAQLLLCEQMLKDGVPYADMEVAVQTLEELATGIQYQANIAEVLYFCDMQDEEAEDNYLFSAEVLTEIESEKLSFIKVLYDSGEYDRFFDEYPEIMLQYLGSYSEETAELEFRNEEILAEFYNLQEDEFEEKIGVLYSEFINNCNEIAIKSGYANYYEYASALIYKRDYSSEERERFREYVKKYIVPLYYLSYAQYEEMYAELPMRDKLFIVDLLYEAYDSLEADYVSAYFEVLPESSKLGMLHMFEEEAYIRVDNKDALEGAFTVGIGVPFCYFGPSYQQAFTIIHEIGHYYAGFNVNTSWLSYDLCETQSQGNEMLFLTYLETVLEPEVFEVLEAYRLYYFIDSIMVATLMDEFEETIYQLPDQVNYTAKDFDEIMDQIIMSYGMDADDEYIRANMEWIWRTVGIRYPVYYLNYATSAMAALNLYGLSQEDFDAALEAYRIIQEEADIDKNFMGTLEKAGIDSVFEEEAYIKLQGPFEEKSELALNLELKETDNPRIMEILNTSGIYTDSVNNTGGFSYQIPQLNADSESAKIVNQRIVDDIYPLVEDEFECMSDNCSLLNYFITYEVIEYGDIVAILVTVPYPNDCMDYFAYSYDFKNDKEVTNIELLASHGMTEEDFVETACEMEIEYFTALFEGGNEDETEWYKECIEEAKAATTAELPMYLGTDGTLNVYIPFPSAAGASWYYQLCQF